MSRGRPPLRASLYFFGLQLLKEWEVQGCGSTVGGATEPCQDLGIAMIGTVLSGLGIREVHPHACSFDAIISEQMCEVGGIAKAS